MISTICWIIIFCLLIIKALINVKKDNEKYKKNKYNDCVTFCVNDEVFCKCRSCKESMLYDGVCNHCFTCITGEKNIDSCEYYYDIHTPSE